MPKRLTVNKLSPGTPSTSKSRSYKTKNNHRKSSKISKYFTPIQNADITVDSPYKNLLTYSNDKIKPLDISDDCDDFKSPKPVSIAKVFQISKQNNTAQSKTKIKRTYKKRTKNPGTENSRKTNITKLFVKSVGNDNCVSAEHLHMAIALSKSEMQNGGDNDDDDESVSDSDGTTNISSQEKKAKFKAALEQFGFHMPNADKTYKPRNVTETKRRKKSKIPYITPILLTRSDEERLEIIKNKISSIIDSNRKVLAPIQNEKYQIFTDDLLEFVVEDGDMCRKNGLCLKNEEYFIPSLKIPHSEYIPGCLLKKWSDISGRDKSPNREDEEYFKVQNNDPLNSPIENQCNKNPPCIKTTPIQEIPSPLLQFVEQNYDTSCEDNRTETSKSENLINTSTRNQQLLSPDLFSSGEDETSTNEPLETDNSVINITLSQTDKINESSVKNGNLESVQLRKLEKILRTRVFDQSKLLEEQEDVTDEDLDTYEDCFKHDNLKKSTKVDKLIDLTINTDSDCCIIEDLEASTSKCKLQRFGSFNSTTSVDSNVSHKSDVSIVISDEELNYSTLNSTSCKKQKGKRIAQVNNCDSTTLVNMSTIFKDLVEDFNDSAKTEDILKKGHENNHCTSILQELDDIALKYTQEIQNTANFEEKQKSNDVIANKSSNLTDLLNSPSLLSDLKNIQNSPILTSNINPPDVTPNNGNFIIKTDNITPLPNYLDMNTPKIAFELKKFGLKPLKRKRGVQLLQYLYDVTHPEVPNETFVESGGGEYPELDVKRHKSLGGTSNAVSVETVANDAEEIEIIGDMINESESMQDLILEHKKSVKVSTCPVPLNIAWHNLLAANPSIRESLLMYEPLEVERLYAMLKAQGLKYNVQELVTFLDRKCITIRTKQNTVIARNKIFY